MLTNRIDESFVYELNVCYLTVDYRQTLDRDHPLSLHPSGTPATLSMLAISAQSVQTVHAGALLFCLRVSDRRAEQVTSSAPFQRG